MIILPQNTARSVQLLHPNRFIPSKVQKPRPYKNHAHQSIWVM